MFTTEYLGFLLLGYHCSLSPNFCQSVRKRKEEDKQTFQGKCFITAQVEYEEYTEDELRPFLDRELEKKVLPPICQGKKYILDNLNTLYFLTLNQEEVMRKLQS